MTPLDELAQLAGEGGRRIFVTEGPIDLTTNAGTNCVYVLELPGAVPGAAGGRIGGLGERRVQRVLCFRKENDRWVKVYETDIGEKVEKFDLPYHAAGLDVVLPDGSTRVVSGVVDPELVRSYNESV
ncbi:MAG TPA: hypothetical protein VLV18_11055 [Terriglobales bacterium]|nr:hypothetical protein [Terriglobales bacterium]